MNPKETDGNRSTSNSIKLLIVLQQDYVPTYIRSIINNNFNYYLTIFSFYYKKSLKYI